MADLSFPDPGVNGLVYTFEQIRNMDDELLLQLLNKHLGYVSEFLSSYLLNILGLSASISKIAIATQA